MLLKLVWCHGYRERDELVTELTGLRARYGDLKMREEDAYQQVKKSVEMVEQAQLEQTQVRWGSVGWSGKDGMGSGG